MHRSACGKERENRTVFAPVTPLSAPAPRDVVAMQEVGLLFTRYSDIFGRIVGLLTGSGFSHVSVSPDLGSGVFYSFNIKGFAVERPLAHSPRRRLKGSLLLRLKVDGESHERLMRALGRYLDERESYSYSKLGFVACLAGIRYRRPRARFCSQFVAEVLKEAGVAKETVTPELCLPAQLADRRCFRFAICESSRDWIEASSEARRNGCSLGN